MLLQLRIRSFANCGCGIGVVVAWIAQIFNSSYFARNSGGEDCGFPISVRGLFVHVHNPSHNHIHSPFVIVLWREQESRVVLLACQAFTC